MPVNQFSQQINFIMAALSGAERIFEMMGETPEIDNGTVTLSRVCRNEDGSLRECNERTGKWAWHCPQEDGGVKLVPLRGDVRFHDVVFGYTPGRKILNKINLYAKPGQKIAFVGSTGAGKTTITNLINRFYEIDSGSITYDGIDVREIRKDDLRRSLSVVLQDVYKRQLFNEGRTFMERTFYRALYKTFHAMKNNLRPRMGEIGLSPGQPKILDYLTEQNFCMQKEIAEACDIDPATVSQILNNMEQNVLIRRVTPTNDRRSLSIEITGKGKEMHEKWEYFRKDAEEIALKGFSKEEKELLADYLWRAYGNLANRGLH